ncbi:MAG TPA: triose-phosphate isomerase [Rhodobiaceae bacterium]|nr:triose-phosphate isomerase [Rhodobiaceae bacterium]|tara:strand:- start:188 stop:934 length:747 start_codon:yes stop_codon:yes gene_type:complete
MPIRPAIIGNWKMNGSGKEVKLVSRFADFLDKHKIAADVMICPPATLIGRAGGAIKGSKLKIGAQNCHVAASGAYTGDVSASMLKDAGAKAVIVGHSERRAGYDETDKQVRQKAQAVIEQGLQSIICVGETRQQFNKGQTLQVVGRQLRGSIPSSATPQSTLIAYEPVWAIGSGRTPKPADILRTHAHLRKTLLKLHPKEGAKFKILYGGSVSAANASDILALENVNGALVGGASLSFKDFTTILRSV